MPLAYVDQMRARLVRVSIYLVLIAGLLAIFGHSMTSQLFTAGDQVDTIENSLTVIYRSDLASGVLVNAQVSTSKATFSIELLPTEAYFQGQSPRTPILLFGTGTGERFIDCMLTKNPELTQTVGVDDVDAKGQIIDAQGYDSIDLPSGSAIKLTLYENHSVMFGGYNGSDCAIAPGRLARTSQARHRVSLPWIRVVGLPRRKIDPLHGDKLPPSIACVRQGVAVAASQNVGGIVPTPAIANQDLWGEVESETLRGRIRPFDRTDPLPTSWQSCSNSMRCPRLADVFVGECATVAKIPSAEVSLGDEDATATRESALFIAGALVGVIGGLVVEVVSTLTDGIDSSNKEKPSAPTGQDNRAKNRRILRRLRAYGHRSETWRRSG